jgi:hypothetical protein
MESAMGPRVFAALCLALMLPAPVNAEDGGARIDLDVIARMPQSQLVPIRINFADASASCPEDHGNLQVSSGTITIHSARLLGRDWGDRLGSLTGLFDDDTQRLRIAADDCSYEIGLRLQKRDNDTWTSFAVPRSPSLRAPLQEWLKALGEETRAAKPGGDANNDSKTEAAAVNDAAAELNAAKGLYPDYYPFSIIVRPENAPDDCVPTFGSYLTDVKGITFTFVTNLSADLNHFAVERADPDGTTARLYLVRDDCRLEITLGKALKRQSVWRPLAVEPIAPVTPGNGAKAKPE